VALIEAYLGLGSNLGDRVANLQRGASLLTERVGELEVSSLYRTLPMGLLSQPEYLNAVGRVRTRLSPFELMHVIRAIESDLGRTRTIANGPRTLDVDILLFGTAVLRGPPVTVPHPRLAERAFALEPLAELAPSLRHPTLGLTISELLEILRPAPARIVLRSRQWGPQATL
jgi:2-amino-4-hydroxy-6-hydroxymethyldihydropteridine diphosphokinase